jgi:hypothetical protein
MGLARVAHAHGSSEDAAVLAAQALALEPASSSARELFEALQSPPAAVPA